MEKVTPKLSIRLHQFDKLVGRWWGVLVELVDTTRGVVNKADHVDAEGDSTVGGLIKSPMSSGFVGIEESAAYDDPDGG